MDPRARLSLRTGSLAALGLVFLLLLTSTEVALRGVVMAYRTGGPLAWQQDVCLSSQSAEAPHKGPQRAHDHFEHCPFCFTQLLEVPPPSAQAAGESWRFCLNLPAETPPRPRQSWLGPAAPRAPPA